MTQQTSNDWEFSEITKKRVMTAWGVAMAVIVAFLAFVAIDRPSHDTLAAAGLTNRAWSDTDVPSARRTTSRQLEALAHRLDEASETGDTAAVWSMADEITQVLRAWNDQGENTRQLGRYCILAALQVSDGMSVVGAGGQWDRQRFDASLKRC